MMQRLMVTRWSQLEKAASPGRHSPVSARRQWTVTHAAANDGRQLPNLIDLGNTASPV
ncbi:hypothetical protein [Shumkonia mesophila]|uniref:hypothetical protein n=1 Tax=Shumkonia mesophila TaxID=2838854 RepID=UPI0029349B4C|nr:hypothetical protein [Shumkonia mesophila]